MLVNTFCLLYHTLGMTLKQTVARRIKVARAEMGLNQGELAELLGITPQGVTKLESGKIDVRIETLGRVAAALHKRIDYFFQEFESVESVKKEQARRKRAA